MQTLVERLYDNKPLMLAAAIIAFLIAALLFLVIARMLFGGRLRMPGGRTRQARLGIVDAFDLDRQRQLIIIRRDNTEHLIMIGGPNDVLIESEIIRVDAREQRDTRREKIEGPGPTLPLGPSFEPRIPAPIQTPERAIETAPVAMSPSLELPIMPLPLPPAIPAPPASMPPPPVAAPPPPEQPPSPQRPTFPLPPRRPTTPSPERRPAPPETVRTEPAAPSLEASRLPLPPSSPVIPPPADEVAPLPAPVPVTPPAPAPAARAAPPPFLRPLPPRPPKILQRSTSTTSGAPPVAPPPPRPEPEVVTPPPPPASPPPSPPASAPKDTLESLEEEMAKLLGRGTSER